MIIGEKIGFLLIPSNLGMKFGFLSKKISIWLGDKIMVSFYHLTLQVKSGFLPIFFISAIKVGFLFKIHISLMWGDKIRVILIIFNLFLGGGKN